MSEIFLTIVNMSISASWLVLAVLVLRLILKKAPKWVNVLLWGFVAFRLVCPVSFESMLSLIPSAETISPQIMTDPAPQITTGITALNGVINPMISDSFTPSPGASANPLQIWIPVVTAVWVAGIALMLIYTAVSYFLLRRKVDTAVRLRNNIFQSENVDSPFVLGILKPTIYLPFQMDSGNLEYVIAHEEAHIRRKDHWWKPFGFVLLAVHWFNPLMWVGYLLLCRDIELACDEKVIKELDNDNRANYTQALVACSINRRSIAACPLAFGEVGVKERVKSVMNYKKPGFWIMVAAVVICIVVAVCFLTNPDTGIDDQLSVFIDCQIAGHFQTEKSEGNACCVNWEVLGTKKRGPVTTVYMWVLYEEYSLQTVRMRNEENSSQIDDLYVETASHIPTIITVKYEDGVYKLIEYWEPRDGGYLVPGIREKFPWHLQHKALDPQRYYKTQHAENEKMALEYFRSPSQNYQFNAKVIEVHEQYLLVEPEIGSMERTSADRIEISLKDGIAIPKVGNEVIVVYDGQLQESYPARITNVYRIEIMNYDAGPVETIHGNMKTYYKNSDGTWQVDGRIYKYRLEISGQVENEACPGPTTFVYLSNLENITFKQAWNALFSGNCADWFLVDEAVLVDWPTGNVTYAVYDGDDMTAKPESRLDWAISSVIGNLKENDKPDGLLNTEHHIILAHEVVSGTPAVGQTEHIREEAVFVYFLNMQFRVVDGEPEEYSSRYSQAIMTFSVDENGGYILTDYLEPQCAADYDAALMKKFASAAENIAENEDEYNRQLRDGCWETATDYLENLKVQDSAQSAGTTQIVPQPAYSPVIDSIIYDIDGDGRNEICTLTYGPTSGLFSFCLNASPMEEATGTTYSETYVLMGAYQLSFDLAENGSLRIKGESVNESEEDVFFDIAVKDGRIVLQCEEEELLFDTSY